MTTMIDGDRCIRKLVECAISVWAGSLDFTCTATCSCALLVCKCWNVCSVRSLNPTNEHTVFLALSEHVCRLLKHWIIDVSYIMNMLFGIVSVIFSLSLSLCVYLFSLLYLPIVLDPFSCEIEIFTRAYTYFRVQHCGKRGSNFETQCFFLLFQAVELQCKKKASDRTEASIKMFCEASQVSILLFLAAPKEIFVFNFRRSFL